VFVRLHESAPFVAQASVYEALGQRAWSEGLVPWRATSCPLHADVEAELLAAFARDVSASGARPLLVIDVGAGNGRLGFHLSRALRERGVAARLHLTDLARSNVEALASQPQLAALLAEGTLTVGAFDALAPAPPEGDWAGVALLAHYLFDTLPHRAFRKTADGRVLEGLVDVSATPWRWQYEETACPPGLEARGPGTFLVPVGAARALEAWCTTFQGPLLVLAADKGVTPRSPDEDPLIARHESVSAGVDFEVLAHGVGERLRWHAPRAPSDVFALHAFTRGPAPAFDEAWRVRGAANEVLTMLEVFLRQLAAPSVEGVCALLETTHDDPDLLAQLGGFLRSITLDDETARRLVTRLARAAERHFLFPQQLDVPFNLAVTAHHLGALQLAVVLYLLSLQESGAHEATLLNLALAQRALGRTAEALEALEVLLAHTPDHPRAGALLAEWRGG
jgi:hypothetical protein